MTIDVTKTAGNRAEITWDPQLDDPSGWLARVIENGNLEDALAALADEDHAGDTGEKADTVRVAHGTAAITRLLARRHNTLTVRLRDEHGLPWSEIALHLFDDADKVGAAQSAYESGLKYMGLASHPP
ncbi:hypothetical protein HRW14_32810, partial [Streptomyces lunaelactis]|uniref:hypothetical protein n=1 Tax=Streptomyces lunaelactis TaxID=1535768 RepID=UPI001584F75B